MLGKKVLECKVVAIISGYEFVVEASNGRVMDSFSSLGAERGFQHSELLKSRCNIVFEIKVSCLVFFSRLV